MRRRAVAATFPRSPAIFFARSEPADSRVTSTAGWGVRRTVAGSATDVRVVRAQPVGRATCAHGTPFHFLVLGIIGVRAGRLRGLAGQLRHNLLGIVGGRPGTRYVAP